ncbi:potassium ion transport [Aureococcus anophagefferens]|nr:potassium ion transport [Aureococcus anophagefferens]
MRRGPRRRALRGAGTLRPRARRGAGVDARGGGTPGRRRSGRERALRRDDVARGAASSARAELVAALRRASAASAASPRNVAMSYVPAVGGPRRRPLRRVLEPATGLLVLADSDFSERLEPTLVEGAHHERRPFADYDANLKAAGFELVERTTYLVGDDAFFAGVWRCAAPPKSRAAVAAARKPKRRAAPAADIPGLP